MSLRAMRNSFCAMLFALLACTSAFAWENWSADPINDTGNCATCHGKFGFVGQKYTSLHDGTVWTGDLMTGHGTSTMTGCMECHQVEGDQPVLSRCASCHGREEDGGALQISAGLVQHHEIKGVTTCSTCHTLQQSIVGENVVPAKMLQRGIDPCKDALFGPDGLDNDGDGLYDEADSDCQVEPIRED